MTARTFLGSSLLVAGLLCATALPAVAQGQGGGRGRGGVLTAEQRTKLQEARQGSQEKLTQLREKLTAAQRDAVKAVLADADEATLRAKIEAVHKIQTDLALVQAKVFKTVLSDLTAEQKTQLEESPMGYGQVFGMMGGGGRGGRRGGGGGGGGNN